MNQIDEMIDWLNNIRSQANLEKNLNLLIQDNEIMYDEIIERAKNDICMRTNPAKLSDEVLLNILKQK